MQNLYFIMLALGLLLVATGLLIPTPMGKIVAFACAGVAFFLMLLQATGVLN